ncbi:acyltransferase domain-containing protein [Streptomyces inhibens]|uniref:acyltransferase domain-containing protein n=1 Tax=Streptomyces inhibens TaxID=2293571 RepID=UPI0036A4F3B9
MAPADSPAQAARRRLRAWQLEEGEVPAAALASGAAHGRAAFVFSRNGSQWAGMGAELLDSGTAFATPVSEVAALLRSRPGWRLRFLSAAGTGAEDEMGKGFRYAPACAIRWR